MAQQSGDYFRSARFGGFHKADVMQFIEELEQRLHEQTQAMDELSEKLKEARKAQLRWMEDARQQRKRSAAANLVQRELTQFQRRLDAAQELTAEVEKENIYLREQVRAQEDGSAAPLEAPSVPLEQLTFRLFIDDEEEEDSAELAYFSGEASIY